MIAVVLGVLGAVTGVASLVFVVVQTRTQSAAADLTLNLDVLERIDTTMLAIAASPTAYAYVWGPEPPPVAENGTEQVLADSVLDAVEIGLRATERLPSFKRNRAEWEAYVSYLFDRSATLLSHAERWGEMWPYVTRFRTRTPPH